jgi:hypothetical protein
MVALETFREERTFGETKKIGTGTRDRDKGQGTGTTSK